MSGIDFNDSQSLKIQDKEVKFFISHLDISGNDNNKI